MAEVYNSNNLSAEDLAEAYTLHPSDHPRMMLVSKVFDGNGFIHGNNSCLSPNLPKESCSS